MREKIAVYSSLIIIVLFTSCNVEDGNKDIQNSKKMDIEIKPEFIDTTKINLDINGYIESINRYVYEYELEEWLLHEYVFFDSNHKIDFAKSFYCFNFENNDTIFTKSSYYLESFIGQFGEFDSCKVEVIKNNDTVIEYLGLSEQIQIKYDNLECGFNSYIVNIRPFESISFEDKNDKIIRKSSSIKVIYKQCK